MHAELIDFDLDSHGEIVVSSNPFSLVIAPAFGGAIYEWDDIPSRYNLLNIMTRRREGYHIDLQEAAARNDVITPEMPQWNAPEWLYTTHVRAKQLGLERDLVVDWHRRGSLIDHFLGDDVTLDSFRRASYGETGDFVLGGYTAEVGGSGTTVLHDHAQPRGARLGRAAWQQPVRVEKRLTITAGVRELLVEYTVTNLADVPLQTALRHRDELRLRRRQHRTVLSGALRRRRRSAWGRRARARTSAATGIGTTDSRLRGQRDAGAAGDRCGASRSNP